MGCAWFQVDELIHQNIIYFNRLLLLSKVGTGAKRVMQIVRGTHATFKATFVDADGEPLVSADATRWPAVVIKNPAGEEVYNAVGRSIGSGGNYQFEWFVPVDAELNVLPRKWTINWFFTNAQDHTRSTEQFFDVVDKMIPTEEESQIMYLTRDGTAERLILPLIEEPQEISITIQNSSFSTIAFTNQVASRSEETYETVALRDRKIGLVVEEGMYKYYYNTDVLTTGEYPVFWDVRDTPVSPKVGHQQFIRVPENKYWLFNKSLRMLIDKLRKKLSTFQAYTEDQIYEFMIRGLGFVNGIEPATDWTLSTIPERIAYGVAEAMLLAAAKYALISQQILETELSFDHSGQTVTLSVNHDYGSVIGHIDGMLDKFSEAKPRLYRIMCPIGVVGVRRYNLGYRSKVYKIGPGYGLDPASLGSQLVMSMDI